MLFWDVDSTSEGSLARMFSSRESLKCLYTCFIFRFLHGAFVSGDHFCVDSLEFIQGATPTIFSGCSVLWILHDNIWKLVSFQKVIYVESLNPCLVPYLLYFQAPQCCELCIRGSVNWSHRRQSRFLVWAKDPKRPSRSGWKRSWSPRSAVVSTRLGSFILKEKKSESYFISTRLLVKLSMLFILSNNHNQRNCSIWDFLLLSVIAS